jgi:hypothetical protein
MEVHDLDGNIYNWQLVGYQANPNIKKSGLHMKAREMITEIFPTLQILEEVPIKITRNDTLYLDFYIPLKRLCIETHGEQHYKFIAHYHGNALGFLRHQKRDKLKKEWCNLNGIDFIELPFNESYEQWLNRLRQQKIN